jgi:hypothetical protein
MAKLLSAYCNKRAFIAAWTGYVSAGTERQNDIYVSFKVFFTF